MIMHDEERERSLALERDWMVRRGAIKPGEVVSVPSFGGWSVHETTLSHLIPKGTAKVKAVMKGKGEATLIEAIGPLGLRVGQAFNSKLLVDFEKDSVVILTIRVTEKTNRVQSAELVNGPVKVPVKAEKEETMSAAETKSTGYYVAPDARLVFSTVHKRSLANPNQVVKLMILGGSGFGKTTLPELFAKATGRELYYMNCASIRDPEEWFGFREAREGSTVFIRSQFINTIEKGNAVVILDEFNRLEPWLHNPLFPLLDHRGKTVVHDEEFTVGQNVVIVGTINTGYRYTGVFELDEALLNRFEFVLEVSAMPVVEEVAVLVQRTGIDEKKAASLVKVANILRQSDVVCSTRTTLNVADMVVAGMDLRQAYENAVVRRIPVDSAGTNQRKAAIDAINSQLGAFQIAKVIEGDVFSAVSGIAAPPVEEEVEEKVPAFTFRKKEGISFANLGFQKILRSLPVVIGITSAEAASLAEAVEKGGAILVPLSREFTADDPLIAELRKVGVTGRYHKSESKVRGEVNE